MALNLSPLLAAGVNPFAPHVLAVIVLAAAYGLFVGSTPGLTATMAVALLVPVTFFLDDVSAIAAIVSVTTCSIFAGDIPGTLLRIPGTPASAAYAVDAYARTRAGDHLRTLGVCLIFSVAGGLIGLGVLWAAAPQLARIPFIAFDYFWLCVLGLSCAALVSHGSKLKGALSLLIGLLLSTVGLSSDYASPRFTFGIEELYGGVNFIPAMIGLFGLSEVFRNALRPSQATGDVRSGRPVHEASSPSATSQPAAWRRLVWEPTSEIVGGALRLLSGRKLALLRSSAIGSFIGFLPGAGADLAAWISYAVSKRFARRPHEYGQGSLEGIADASGANNAALAAAWIPALALGIPGDSVTAIAIGVLMMKDIRPGPRIFVEQADLMTGLYLTFLMANLVLLPLGVAAIRGGSLLVRVPRRVLLPLIVMFCVLGAYAIEGKPFDVGVMLAMGLLGFFLESIGAPLGPVVLGIILGNQLESYFLQSVVISDSPLDFVGRPISRVLATICLVLWLTPLLLWLRQKRPAAEEAGTESKADRRE